MKLLRLPMVTLLCLVPVEARAHDLQHRVATEPVVTISLFFGNGDPFSYESFEIYREGEAIPFQTGRTDALGHITFLPDRAGNWRVKVYSEDGHGADLTLSVDEHLQARRADAPLFPRYIGILTGIGVILGVFGLISLVRRRGT